MGVRSCRRWRESGEGGEIAEEGRRREGRKHVSLCFSRKSTLFSSLPTSPPLSSQVLLPLCLRFKEDTDVPTI